MWCSFRSTLTHGAGAAAARALSCDDIFGAASDAPPGACSSWRFRTTYYDDLAARFPLEPEFIDRLKRLDLLYDQDDAGEFIHFYTPTIGAFFLEMVQHRDGYDEGTARRTPL